MFRPKYHLNPETLRFEKAKHPFRKSFASSCCWFIFFLVLAAGLRIGIDKYYDSPKVVRYTEKNKQLREAYSFLMKDVNRANDLLSDFQTRDERLYRSVLNLEPIPQSIREAGFGGSENYIEALLSRSEGFVVRSARDIEKLYNKVKIQSVSLHELNENAQKQRELIASRPSLRPISPGDAVWLTSTYGYRSDPFTRRRVFHQGIDLAGNPGINIHAAGEGVVVSASMSRVGYGNEVVIDHGFGYTTRYAHLLKIHVKKGDKIKRGQLLGELGNSGRSTGPHLHYEVLHNNRALNPMLYFFENLTPEEYTNITSMVIN